MANTTSTTLWSSLDTEDHTSHSLSLQLVNAILLSLVLPVFTLRLGTKLLVKTKPCIGDYLMTASVLCFAAYTILNLVATTLGFGRHVWDIPQPLETIPRVHRLNYIALTLLFPAQILAKLSVIDILLRIFPPWFRVLRAFLFALGAVIIGCCVTEAVLVLYRCVPGEHTATETLMVQGACYVYPRDKVAVALGVLNAVTDLVICMTPVPYLFLQVELRLVQRLCLVALLLGGLAACAVSILRVLSLRHMDNALDITFVTVPYFNMSTLELALIILTSSLPSLRPLFVTILPSFLASRRSSHLHASSSFPLGDSSEGSLTENKRMNSSYKNRPTSAWTQPGEITIVTEYHIEESVWPKGMEMPPVPRPWTPRLGPKVITTCEKVGQ